MWHAYYRFHAGADPLMKGPSTRPLSTVAFDKAILEHEKAASETEDEGEQMQDAVDGMADVETAGERAL